MKRTCQLLRLKASAELAADHSEEALRDVLLLLRLVDAPRGEPFLISQLVRVACLEITLQPIWEGLGGSGRRWSDSQVQTLQRRLEQFNFVGDLKQAMDGEQVWGNVTIGLLRDKRAPNSLLALLSEDNHVDAWVREADRAFTKCPRDWFDQEQRNFNRFFEE